MSECKNGLQLVFDRFTGSNVVHIAVTIGAGTRHEPAGKAGLAHFTEHSVFKGTKKFKSKQILNYLESSGGELNAFTTKEETCYYASVHSEQAEKAFYLLSQLVFYPVFPGSEINREKSVVLEEIESYKDSPAEIIFDEFEELIFKKHPLSVPILGSAFSVSSFRKKDLSAFTSQNYIPGKMSLSVSGNLSFSFVKHMVKKYFSPGKSTASAATEHVVLNSGKPFFKVKKPDTHQSHVLLGGISYSYASEKRTALSLLNNIFGGHAMNSRLNVELREKRGWAYIIESNYTPYSDTGFFSVYFGTERKNVEKCITLIKKEMKKLAKDKLTPSQLFTAKQQIKGQIAMAEENRLSKTLGAGKSILALGKVVTAKEIYKKIDRLKSTELCDVANEIMNPEKLNCLIYKS
ncbi:MAG: M16 family metallopeptidase [Bacteroidota bacterium]